jgi:hypothetical protein
MEREATVAISAPIGRPAREDSSGELGESGALSAFVAAQQGYAGANSGAVTDDWPPSMHRAESQRQEAFRASAIAASHARERGVTLQAMVDANRAACAGLPTSIPAGTLYTSLEAVTYHALCGDLLRKPDRADLGAIVPTEVQALIVATKRVRATREIRTVIDTAESQQQACSDLRELQATGRSAVREFAAVPPRRFGPHTLELHLQRALEHVTDGQPVSSRAASLIAALAEQAGEREPTR